MPLQVRSGSKVPLLTFQGHPDVSVASRCGQECTTSADSFLCLWKKCWYLWVMVALDLGGKVRLALRGEEGGAQCCVCQIPS